MRTPRNRVIKDITKVTYGMEGPVQLRIGRPDLKGVPLKHVQNKRGQITHYSPGSKTRLRRQVWRFTSVFSGSAAPYSSRPYFFTLTLPGRGVEWWKIDHKRALDRFLTAVRRKCPGALGFWVLEYQSRKHVDPPIPAAHYQGVIQLSDEDAGAFVPGGRWLRARVGSARFDLLQEPWSAWVHETWARVVGEECRTEIEPARTMGEYLAKESTKSLQKEAAATYAAAGVRPTGRWWGLINRKLVKEFEVAEEWSVTNSELFDFIRQRDAYWTPIFERKAARLGWSKEELAKKLQRLPRYLPKEGSGRDQEKEAKA